MTLVDAELEALVRAELRGPVVELAQEFERLINKLAPQLLSQPGVGPRLARRSRASATKKLVAA